MRILLTTTSFQDTPGHHHDQLAATGWEIVRERGPLSEARMLELAGGFDGFLCGDDAITQAVIERSLPRLKVIAKYGIGLDKIDVAHATAMKLPVLYTPGVNHTTVAEHTFALLLALSRHLVEECNITAAGQWKRLTGTELHGKRMGIFGLGRIGKEVAVRARAFGMTVVAHDVYWDSAFADAHLVGRAASAEELIRTVDVLSLHANLTPETHHLLNAERLAGMRKGAFVVNCARGELVDSAAMRAALDSGQIGGYGTDVLDVEPPPADHPLLGAPRCIVTPHIGSRTYESVQRQAGRAVRNLIEYLTGGTDFIQAN